MSATDPKPDTAASTESGSAAALPVLQSQLTAMLGPMLDDFRKQLRSEADTIKADISASTAEVRKQQDDAALAAVHRRIDGVLDPAALAGKLTPGEKQRKRDLLLTQDSRKTVKTETRDGREVPVTQFDLALADLTADLADRTPERFSERLRGGPNGTPGTVSAERQRELLALTPTGQSALEHAAKLLAAAPNN